jgi:hypothetical protein
MVFVPFDYWFVWCERCVMMNTQCEVTYLIMRSFNVVNSKYFNVVNSKYVPFTIFVSIQGTIRSVSECRRFETGGP